MSRLKVGVLALSISKEISEKLFLRTVSNFRSQNCEIIPILIAQGFDISEKSSEVKIIEDSSQIGKPISVVRDYFTKMVLENFDLDYILFVDDDVNFKEGSGDVFAKYLNEIINDPSIGLVNFKESKKKVPLKEVNPAGVYVRSGILIPCKVLREIENNFWGGLDECIYYEECILALNIYLRGRKTLLGGLPILHRSRRDGLGKTIERYENFDSIKGGRQILYSKGLICLKTDSEGYLDYRSKPSLSQTTLDLHRKESGRYV